MATARELAALGIDAYLRGDIDWIVEHSSPDIVTRQPEEFPDARTYEGHAGLREAFVDWPSQWELFEIVAMEIVEATDNSAMTVTRHHVRGRGGLDFELDVFNVITYEDGLATSWDMFTDRETALSRLQSTTPGRRHA